MMNIGQKIKELRSAKMMTQQELAGEHITRNMLSRIENGCALPSLPTLLYISERLGVPAGFLLVGENEEFQYKKAARMPDIMSAYQAGDWEICRDLCESLGETDNELQYIICLCLFNEAKEAFIVGDLRKSALLFDLSRSATERIVYPALNILAESETYLLCISYISPSLVADIETVSAPMRSSLSDSFCRYFSLIHALDGSDVSIFDPARYSSPLSGEERIYADHIVAKMKMRSGHFNEAYHVLKQILSSDADISAPILYFIFTDLEICCRELSDYRGAYEYSNDKNGMMEKFLG